MTRRIQSATALQAEFVTAACTATGKDAEEVTRIIAPVIEHLQTHYSGEKLYVPKRGRTIDIDKLRKECEDGIPVRKLCERYGISRRTLHRLISDSGTAAKK